MSPNGESRYGSTREWKEVGLRTRKSLSETSRQLLQLVVTMDDSIVET